MEPVTTADIDGKVFPTEVNMGQDEEDKVDPHDSDTSDSQMLDSDAPAYSIQSAVPPEDWDSPYSQLPGSAKTHLQRI